LAVWTLRRRPENAIDRWDGQTYRRVLPLGDKAILLEVAQLPGSGPPRLSVHVHSDGAAPQARAVATAAVERLLGIRLDLSAFYEFASEHARLDLLALRFRGMKPPRYLTGFECLANAIACQQISLAAGIQLLNRLGEAFGRPYRNNGDVHYAFPRPEDFVQATPDDLRGLGLTRNKGIALLNLAGLIRNGQFDLDALQTLPDDEAVAELCLLRGVGRWSAEYALLRGMGRLHVFPQDDIGARNSLAGWLELSEKLNDQNIQPVLERWRPFCGLIYFHLLLDKLAAGGHVAAHAV
jgi:DNA-3-methyladenine glycosylase II